MRFFGNEQNPKVTTLTTQGAGNGSTDYVNGYGRGVKVVINITAISGTSPTLTVTIQGKDPTSGQYWTILASAALTATGTTVLTVYPALTAAANTVANDVLPPNWNLKWVVGGTGPSVTATISAQMVA